MRKFSKGQSTLEYIIILAAVIGAIIAIGGTLSTKMTGGYDTLGNTMKDKIEKVTF